MQNNTTTPAPADPAPPEWASRWLKVREVAAIQGENPSTVYRKVEADIYPGLVQFGSSSRMAGWELWERGQQRLAARDETEAA